MDKKLIKLLFSLVFLINYSISADCSTSFENDLKKVCESLKINSTHSCIYSNRKCEFKYSSCASYTGKDSNECKLIPASDEYKRCEIKDNVCTEVDRTCEEYDINEDLICENFNVGTSKRCQMVDSKCETHYNKCEDYTKDEGVDEKKCNANIPSISSHKCVWDKTNNKCKEVDKECNDYLSQFPSNSCYSLKTSDDLNKICIESENGCIEQYKTCELYNEKETSKSPSKCKDIRIYSDDMESFDDNRICYFSESDSTCKSRYKLCSDFLEKNECENFTPEDENKMCIYTGTECKEQYKSCQLYNEYANPKLDEECKNIILYSYQSLDQMHVCDMIDGSCQKRDKKCEEYKDEYSCLNYSPYYTNTKCVFKNGECLEQYRTCELYNQNTPDSDKKEEDCINMIIDSTSKCKYDKDTLTCSTIKKECKELSSYYEQLCNQHYPDDKDKKCIWINNECVEQFTTCEKYDEQTDKVADVCNKIIPYESDGSHTIDSYSKCFFNSESKCVRVKKDCSEFDNYYHCGNHELDDSENKRCIFEDNKCKEIFRTCSNYNSVKNKKKEECESVVYRNSSGKIDYHYKCVFENEICKEKYLEKCEDYEPGLNNEKYCTNIQLPYYKRCVFENNSCVQEYATCPGNNEDVSDKICKAIIPYEPYYKCALDENNKCVKKKKECSEYKGRTSSECEEYFASEENKKCFYEDGICEAKYYECSGYTGKDKSICESIVIHDQNNWHQLMRKCVMENGVCTMKKKECKEYTNEFVCTIINLYLYLEGEDKRCVYYNNECIEQWKDCSTYSDNAEKVEKSVCESIILSSDSKKCVFESGETKNSCVEKDKLCSDFKIDDYKDHCIQLTPSFEKKCVYSNSNCEETGKTCLELENITSVTESICSAASTSNSDKQCILKEDHSGCEEVNNPDKKNSGFGLKYNLVIKIFTLLFLFL